MAASKSVEIYDSTGKLLSITDRTGQAQMLAYDANNRLVSVTDDYGRSLAFGYDGQNRINRVIGLETQEVGFAYDTANNLTTIIYADGKEKTYLHEDPNAINAVTGIIDENNNRYATYGYDAQGRARSESLAGSADVTTLSYGTNSTTVTDALGTARTHTFTTILGVVKSTGQSQPGGPGCNASSSSISYDANGNVASRTDFNGTVTTYTYDLTRNLETQRVEANGTTVARTLSTQWHPVWRLQTRLAEPKKISTWVYNGQPDPTNGGAILTCAPADAYVVDTIPIAVLCKEILQPTTDASGAAGFAAAADGPAQVWSYTYDRYGHVLTANGPRTDASDLTTYTYWPADATCPGAAEGTGMDKGCRGELQRVTDALGHHTDYLKYNAHGQLLQMTDANGVAISFTYDARRRLTSRTIDNKATTYTYTPWGGLEQVTRPDGSWTHYTYDPAHRLTGLADNVGNATHFVLDAAGSVLQADTSDAGGQLARRIKTDFDALGRPWKHYNAAGFVTETQHDAMDRLNQVIDAKTRSTLYSWDALGRLQTVEDPQSPTHGFTQMSYDGQDALASLSAPNNAPTSFTVNGLGQVKQENSADRGSVTATYDEAGNLKSRQDATGRKSNFSYDALNRLTQRQNMNSSGQVEETLTYTWDAAAGCAYGIGRLCQINDGAGTTTFSFDARGNRVSETRVEAGRSYTTAYTPDAADRNVALVAPTGILLDQARDAAGRVSRVSANATILAEDIAYDGAGAITGQTLGGSLADLRSRDSDARLQAADLPATATQVSLGSLKPFMKTGQAVTLTVSSPLARGSLALCIQDCVGANKLAEQPLTDGAASFDLSGLATGVYRLYARYQPEASPLLASSSATRKLFVGIPPSLFLNQWLQP
jgi:YD repeat-containing protein